MGGPVSRFLYLSSPKIYDHSLKIYSYSLNICEILHPCRISQFLGL